MTKVMSTAVWFVYHISIRVILECVKYECPVLNILQMIMWSIILFYSVVLFPSKGQHYEYCSPASFWASSQGPHISRERCRHGVSRWEYSHQEIFEVRERDDKNGKYCSSGDDCPYALEKGFILITQQTQYKIYRIKYLW